MAFFLLVPMMEWTLTFLWTIFFTTLCHVMCNNRFFLNSYIHMYSNVYISHLVFVLYSSLFLLTTNFNKRSKTSKFNHFFHFYRDGYNRNFPDWFGETMPNTGTLPHLLGRSPSSGNLMFQLHKQLSVVSRLCS